MNMTPADDLKPGRWVAITRCKNTSTVVTPFGESQMGDKYEQVTGQPLKLKAVSLPFICVSDGTYVFPVDLRQFDVKVLSSKYAKILSNISRQPDGNVVVLESTKDMKALPDNTGYRICPFCHSQAVVERMTENDRTWRLVCRECGFNGELPKDGEGAC